MQINQPDCGIECIHSALIIKMMAIAQRAVVVLDKRLITPTPTRFQPGGASSPEGGRIGQKAGLVLLGVVGLYFLINILIWWAKG